MRITKSDRYDNDDDCPFRDCERFYCPDHRTLFRTCDVTTEGYEGDFDVINGTRAVVESENECPYCWREYQARKSEKEFETLKRRYV